MGIYKIKTNLKTKWPPPKNKLSKASSTKSGRLMMSIRVENSIRKRPRSSFRTLSVTSDPEMSSPQRLSMKSSAPSIRTTQEQLRRARWLFSSSNSSVDNEHETSTEVSVTMTISVRRIQSTARSESFNMSQLHTTEGPNFY